MKQTKPIENHSSSGVSVRKTALTLLTVAAIFNAPNLEAQTTPAPQPTICNRACWTARNGTCTTTMTSLTRAIIHHTANSGDFTTDYATAKSKMRSTQNYHMDTKGWCDIAYHFMVSAGGYIFEGRKNSMTTLIKGSHAGCGNVDSFGFTFLGYFHPPYNQDPPVAMRNAMYDAIAWRMPSGWSPYGSRTTYSGSLNGTGAPLDTHRWVGAATETGCAYTACPGDVIINNYITTDFNGGPMRNGVGTRRGYFPGDFTGDGRTDFALFTPATGGWKTRSSVGTGAVTTFTLGQNGDIPLIGNWSTQSGAEAAVFRPSTGMWYVRSGITGGLLGSFVNGQNGDIPLVGAWSGRMRDTAAYRPSTGMWYVRFGTSGLVSSFIWGGTSGDIPLVADVHGNGMVDQVIYRPADGNWYVRNGVTGTASYFSFPGLSGDIALVGAWSGQMRDMVLFRPSTGMWYIRWGSDGHISAIQHGQNGDQPMVGNVFGNGIIDQCVFRPSTGMWYVRNGSTGTISPFAFGTSADKLVHQ